MRLHYDFCSGSFGGVGFAGGDQLTMLVSTNKQQAIGAEKPWIPAPATRPACYPPEVPFLLFTDARRPAQPALARCLARAPTTTSCPSVSLNGCRITRRPSGKARPRLVSHAWARSLNPASPSRAAYTTGAASTRQSNQWRPSAMDAAMSKARNDLPDAVHQSRRSQLLRSGGGGSFWWSWLCLSMFGDVLAIQQAGKKVNGLCCQSVVAAMTMNEGCLPGRGGNV
jgi:hypothetical protein